MERALVDSNIFLDYYLDRKDSVLPLGEFAFQFIQETIRCKYLVLVCDEVVSELSENTGLTEDNVWELILDGLKQKNKIELVHCSIKEAEDAHRIAKDKNVAFNDALLAILARNNKVMVVTRDNHFFNELSEYCEAIKPEELY